MLFKIASDKMGKYKLIYFDLKARAEVSRLLFALAGQEYEDKRVPREEWPELKKKTPFGQMPILEVDGETLCQSRTIERFLARRFGLAGKNEMEQAKVDMIMECMEDTLKFLSPIFREQDEEKKKSLKKKWEEELVGHMSNLQKLLESNNRGDAYFVGNDVTVADLSVAHFLGAPSNMGVDNKLDDYPKLKAHKQRIESLPKIAEWIAKRPKTQV